MDRRRFVTGLAGLAGATALGGCLGGPGGAVDTPPTRTETPRPTDSGEHPVTPSETTFEVLNRTCGNSANEATVQFDDDSVRVDGRIGGRDTCDTAQLASASLHLDVLEVVVRVVEEPQTETVACAQCLTDIAYSLTAAGLRGGPARVRVVHETADGRETVTVADRP
jgi:hypothetical protein